MRKKTNYPIISIVTPSYNQRNYIEDTIQSVISQKGEFYIEYIIVDGGSTDGSLKIIEKYDKKINQERIKIQCRGIKYKYIYEKDKGQYDAINKGFLNTSGGIMAWLNSDDVYMPNAFSTVTDIFNKFTEVSWITGNETKINSKGQIIEVNTSLLFPRNFIINGLFNGKHYNFIQQESTFWRKSLWDSINDKINNELEYASDYELWTKFAEKTDLIKINTQLGAFRKHKSQKTNLLDKYTKEINHINKTNNIKLYHIINAFLSKALFKCYFFERFALLKNFAFVIYYSQKKRAWIMKKVRGKYRYG